MARNNMTFVGLESEVQLGSSELETRGPSQQVI